MPKFKNMVHEISVFLEYLSGLRGYSEHTIRAYRRDLQHYYYWLTEELGKDLEEADGQSIRSYMSHLARNGLDGRSVNRSLSSIKGFYRYYGSFGGKDYSSIQSIRSVKKSASLPEFFFEANMYEFLEKLRKLAEFEITNNRISAFSTYRNYLIMELLYSTGCRVSELQAMKVVDFSSKELRVMGKGNKERIVFLTQSAFNAVKTYLTLRSTFLHGYEDKGMLLLNSQRKPLSIRLIQRILARYSEEMQDRVHPHKFRHSFATHLMNEGADIRVIQELLGHSNLSSTQVYTHTSLGKLRDLYISAHPHGRRVKK